MKNRNKILSLILVVVMVFSMATIAGAANVSDYPDAASITYTEAVDVLTALGVLQGFEDTSFGPTKEVTREQAAKIITYIMIGTSAADRLTARASSFSDVASSRWSNPFIEYCVEKGVIKGYGNGKFGPTDPVTGAQMSVMLLKAIGYGAQGEYEGASWQLNAVVDGQSHKILTLDKDYTKAATREEVAYYTFRAITGPATVSYNALFGDYFSWKDVITQDATTTLGESTFSLVSRGKADDLGYGGREWYVNNKQITGFYSTDVILGTVVTNPTVTKSSMYSSYSWDTAIDQYYNGDYTAVASTNFAQRGVTTSYPFGASASNNGIKMDLIDTDYDGKVDKVVATREMFAQVTGVNTTTGLTTAKIISNDATANNQTVTVDSVSYAVKDYILVIPNASWAILGDAAVTKTTGTATSYNNNSVTISGTATYLNAYYNGDRGFNEATYYLDSNGYIVNIDGTISAAASLNYLYVSAVNIEHTSSVFAAVNRQVQVTYTDGTKAIVGLSVNAKGQIRFNDAGTIRTFDLTDDLATSTTGVAAAKAAITAGWYSYTKDASGELLLATLLPNNLNAAGGAVPATTNLTIGGTSATAKITTGSGNYYANPTTVLKTVLSGTAKTYTGYANFPFLNNYTVGSGTSQVQALMIMDSTGTVVSIYVISETVVAAGVYGVITGVGDYVANGLRNYTIKVPGEDAKTYALSPAASLTYGTVVELSTTADETTATVVSANEWGEVERVYEGSYIQLLYGTGTGTGNAHGFAGDFVVYDATFSYATLSVGSVVNVYLDSTGAVYAVVITGSTVSITGFYANSTGADTALSTAAAMALNTDNTTEANAKLALAANLSTVYAKQNNGVYVDITSSIVWTFTSTFNGSTAGSYVATATYNGQYVATGIFTVTV